MLNKVFIFIFLLSQPYLNCFSYSYDHLPLCEQLQISFPKLNTNCFIIINEKANVILHEKNSVYKIRFDDNKQKESLNDLISKRDNFSSSSQVSGITFIFTYKNRHKQLFKIGLSGINTIDLFQEDKQKICEWLDQFFIFKVCNKNELLAKIPVIYGKHDIKSVDMRTNKEVFIILSDKLHNNVTKTVKYKSIVNAPFNEKTQLGSLNLSIKTFVNHIKIDIFSEKREQKGGKWKTLLDSIKYLIFGTNFQ